jgi:hypothetical protein
MNERTTRRTIPPGVIAVVADELGNFFTHTKLDNLFRIAGAPCDPPAGNKIDKCSSWLGLAKQLSTCDQPLEVLGEVLGEYMDGDTFGPTDPRHRGRERIQKILEKNQLHYLAGGKVGPAGRTAGATRSLEAMLRDRDLASVEKEFERAAKNVQSDPPAAVTAACAVIESFCRIHIEDHGLELPAKQDLGGLWKIVKADLRLDGGQVADDDIKKVLQGLASIADGVGALRTHAGSAHGKGRQPFRILPRHARLAVHAAHTLVVYLLERAESSGRG